MKTIYLAICGAGHMGLRALCAFPQLRRALRAQDIDISLFAVIDVKSATHRQIKSYLEALLVTTTEPDPYEELEACLDRFRALSPRPVGPLLVYDASPTPTHVTNLSSCLSYRKEDVDVHYLGEKPLIVDKYKLEVLRNQLLPESKRHGLRVFTDFIETQSSVLSAAKRHMEEGFSPTRFRFWREGPGGLKKLLDPRARKGVQGGALLDKAVHDISILHALLRVADTLTPNPEVHVERAVLLPSEIDILLPEPLRPPFTFMSASGRPITDPQVTINEVDHEAADALVEFSIATDDWAATFVSAWLGAADSTAAFLETQHCDPRNFLGQVPVSVFGTETQVPVRDSRLCLATNTANQSLLLDFLYKASGDARTKLVKLAPNDLPCQLDFTTHAWHNDFEYNSLGQTLATACHAILGEDAPLAPFIDEDATLWVHSRLTEVRGAALSLAENNDPETTSRTVLENRLGGFLATIQQELQLRGVILDLDNTVFENEIAVPDLTPVEEAFCNCFDAAFEDYRSEVRRRSPESLVDELFASGHNRTGRTKEEVNRIFQDAYTSLLVEGDLRDNLFPGFSDFLVLLEQHGVKIGLVTSGVWVLQARKLHAIGIAKRFHPIIIDDALAPLGKPHAFEAIAGKWELNPRNILVLGDDASSEIKAATGLGMRAAHLVPSTVDSTTCCAAMLHANNYAALTAHIRPWLPTPPTPAI